MSKRRVVVTGLGAVSPLGLNVDQTWDGIIDAQSGIAPIEQFENVLQDRSKTLIPLIASRSKRLKKWICAFSMV